MPPTFVLTMFLCCAIALLPTNGSTTRKTDLSKSSTKKTSTVKPATSQQPTANPTTSQPPTANPTTSQPPTANPTTSQPPTANPTTSQQPTANPTTSQPPTANPTTSQPPTANPTTSQPPTANPTTSQPPTANPTTSQPPIAKSQPPTAIQTTSQPPTANPTTSQSPTAKPSTTQPSTAKPSVIPAKRNLFLEFKCAANGFITDISGVDKGEVLLLNGSNYCHLNEPNCDWKNKTKLNVLHVKGENSSNIAGGKNAHFYQLECKSAGAFVASANTSMQMKIPAPTDFNQEIKKPTEPTNDIKLVLTDKKGTPATAVHIGDPLLLKITGPAGYTIEPIRCAASSSLDKDYVLWTNKSCSSKDTAVIEDDWKHNTTIPNMVSISMYGFRFVKSNTVVVTCSALFCPIGLQCSANPCVNGKPTVSSRRRRNADQKSKNVYPQESVSTSFTVVDNRIDTSGCSGSFVSVFTYVTACALLLALK